MPQLETKTDLETIYQQYQQLPAKFDSLLLATVDSLGVPTASYAPYIKYEGHFYIYISELAKHTADINDTKRASVLFIENEQEAKHLFARQRVTYSCDTDEIMRGTNNYHKIIAIFHEKFGKIMTTLAEKSDFHLFKLEPKEGGYVAGFGRAYMIKGDDLEQIKHVNDTGHKVSNTH